MTMAESPTLWKKLDWRESAWIAFVTMVTGIALAFLAQQTPLEAAWKRMVTKTYLPIATATYPSTGQEAITIVTVDDLDLDIFGVSWPLQLGFMARRLEAILALAPQALFIDLFLKAESSAADIDALKKVLCKHAWNTRVYIATVGGQDVYSDTERRLFSARAAADDAPPSWNGPPPPCALPVGVRIEADELDQMQWKYPMGGNGDGGWDETEAPSAAPSIFCHQFPDRCPESPSPPLALVWPTTSYKSNVQTMIRASSSSADGPMAADAAYKPLCRNGTLTHDLRNIAPDVMKFIRDDETEEIKKLQPCPYSRVVSLRAFNGYGFAKAELHGAFAGKIVMLGAQIAGSGDTIVSPVNGRLPGVHVHAMALDNLISFDGRYKEYGEVDIRRPLSRASLFVMGSIVMIVVILALWHHLFTPAETPDAPRPASQCLARSQRVLRCLLVAFLGAYAVIRGRQLLQLQPAVRSRLGLLIKSSFIIVQGILIGALFFLGYVFLRQGPLSIAEYVLFPLFAQLADIGKPIALRTLVLVKALTSDDPVQAWCEGFDQLTKEK